MAGTVVWLALSGRPASAVDLDRLPRITALINELVQKEGFDRDALRRLLARARYDQAVVDALSKPAEQLPWHRYRPIFLTKDRIERGLAFWSEQESVLDNAASRFGVPAEILVAIVGVETRYGSHKGKHRVLDSLVTLAASDHRRNGFFLDELRQFLLLTREEGRDPFEIFGSYAGAMGIPQFIASSYRRYAVDFDADGRRDLFRSPGDAIGSIGNYLVEHGWTPSGPILDYVTATGDTTALLAKTLQPDLSRAQMEQRGVVWPATASAMSATTPVALLKFQAADADFLVAGYGNFYAITRYNHSPQYALAVVQLAREIRRARAAGR